MGYYMNMVDADFMIKSENVEPAFQAIKKLIDQVDERGGGGSYFNGVSKRHYSWVSTEELVKSKSLSEFMDEWRWEIDFDENGNVNDICFCGEKLGDDEILFEALAPFVEEGSYIEMRGEESDLWRWVFQNGECVEKTPEIIW